MKQKPIRVGRQVQNPTRNQKEPANDDGTESQKSRETSPGTAPGTRRNQQMMMEQKTKRIGRQVRNQKEPANDDRTECQKSRETNPGTLPGTGKWWWNKACFLEELRTPFSSRAVWGIKRQSVRTWDLPVKISRAKYHKIITWFPYNRAPRPLLEMLRSISAKSGWRATRTLYSGKFIASINGN